MLSQITRERPDAEQRQDIEDIVQEGLRLLQGDSGARMVVDLDSLDATKKYWHAVFNIDGDEDALADVDDRVQVIEDMVASRLGVTLHLHRAGDPDFD
jgi:hypothetical protein